VQELFLYRIFAFYDIGDCGFANIFAGVFGDDFGDVGVAVTDFTKAQNFRNILVGGFGFSAGLVCGFGFCLIFKTGC
jgi:hypothetical protein